MESATEFSPRGIKLHEMLLLKSADDAIQSLNGTVIGKNTVRLSWGRAPNKQWRGDSGQQWNGGYSRGYANHHNSNTSVSTSSFFSTCKFILLLRVKDGRMLLHLLSFPNI
ncbi:BnaA01g26260D [Brassica napus]|uniref:BnaA01g26260D protein n=1 Tax=Brassica napus TaxID=3708 RepID=A0A078FZG4_BRANA|nr:BnaA01g26260D [Brassica napus]